MALCNSVKREIEDVSSECSPSSSKKTSTSESVSHVDKAIEEHHNKRRKRNNIAAKKSRSKTKLNIEQNKERLNKLIQENESLQLKLNILSKELSLLKELFLDHAVNDHGQTLTKTELSYLHKDEP